jgi:hypothetical protein
VNKTGYFNSKDNKLFYVCTIPDRMTVNASVIFVHAANSNRLGPHRMFVELAEKLNNLGISSLRFDMRGCGDSTGKASRNQIEPDIEDLMCAVEFFVSKYSIRKIFLFGISRGARVSFSILAEHSIPISGAILLSTPFYSPEVVAKSFSNRIKEYLYKFENPDNLKKLLTGKVNFKQIAKTFGFALASSQRYHWDNDTKFVTKCPLLFVYGQKDPIANDSYIFYSKICKKFKVPYDISEIENANHSFFHYQWKNQIFDMVEKWLMKNINDGEKDVWSS